MTPTLYLTGNPWQRKAYRHISAYLAKKGVREFGVSGNGNGYLHLLREEDGDKNFIRCYKYPVLRTWFVMCLMIVTYIIAALLLKGWNNRLGL